MKIFDRAQLHKTHAQTAAAAMKSATTILTFNILIIVVIFVMWSFQLKIEKKSKNEVLLVTQQINLQCVCEL